VIVTGQKKMILQSFTMRYVVGRWQVSAAHIFWNTTLCIDDLPLLQCQQQ